MVVWMKKANNFQIEKLSLRVLLTFCLIFCQFQPSVAYKSVAYERKACDGLIVMKRNSSNKNDKESQNYTLQC